VGNRINQRPPYLPREVKVFGFYFKQTFPTGKSPRESCVVPPSTWICRRDRPGFRIHRAAAVGIAHCFDMPMSHARPGTVAFTTSRAKVPAGNCRATDLP
jgi:hypothetical protein